MCQKYSVFETSNWPICATCMKRHYSPDYTMGACSWCLRGENEGWYFIGQSIKHTPKKYNFDEGKYKIYKLLKEGVSGWIVRWNNPETGKDLTKVFNSKKYGDDMALTRMAAEEFREKLYAEDGKST